MAENKLRRYRDRRDFQTTSQPRGSRRRRPAGAPIFVIHKHAARAVHHDLRLELDGVLRSWAVPKGPSTDPRDRRLAVEVEDHPLDYADFEGVIGAGYGAGSVIVWDRGTYRNITEREGQTVPLSEALRDGRASIWLGGEKLRGAYALTRTREAAQPQWLLIKRRDEQADARRDPVASQPRSALSGRTVKEIGEKEGG